MNSSKVFSKALNVAVRASGSLASIGLALLLIRLTGQGYYGNLVTIYTVFFAGSMIGRFGADGWFLMQILSTTTEIRQNPINQATWSKAFHFVIAGNIFAVLILGLFAGPEVWKILFTGQNYIGAFTGLFCLIAAIHFGSLISIGFAHTKTQGKSIQANLLESVGIQTAYLIPLLLVIFVPRFAEVTIIIYPASLALISCAMMVYLLPGKRSIYLASAKSFWHRDLARHISDLAPVIPYLASGILAYLLRWSPPFIAIKILPSESLGVFNFYFRIVQGAYLIGTALNAVMISNLAQNPSSLTIHQGRFLRSAILQVLAACLSAVTIYIFLAKPINEISFIENTQENRITLSLLLFASFLTMFSLKLETILISLGMASRTSLIYFFAFLLFCLITFTGKSIFWLSLGYTIEALLVLLSLAYITSISIKRSRY